jgi:thiamine kinase-like enzyme
VSVTASSDAIVERVCRLPIWSRSVDPQPLLGGITNRNFVVDDGRRKVVVRIGGDNPIHCVLRDREQAASRAAYAAGVSPEVIYTEPDIMVIAHIEGVTLNPGEVRAPHNLERLVQLLHRAHRGVPVHYRGPALIFWPFQVAREYVHRLREKPSAYEDLLSPLLEKAEKLEKAGSPVDMVFGHNDLLAANLIDDGQRLWLVDWEYSGFNSPLFDLGGLASNNAFDADQERALLSRYFDREPDDNLMYRMAAMTAASLMRETLWSMAAEVHSALAFDYKAYTEENLARFNVAYARFQDMDRS